MASKRLDVTFGAGTPSKGYRYNPSERDLFSVTGPALRGVVSKEEERENRKTPRKLNAKVRNPNKATGKSIAASTGNALLNAPSGVATALTEGVPALYDYAVENAPAAYDYLKDTGANWMLRGGPPIAETAQKMGASIRDNPAGSLLTAMDWTPFVGDAKAVGEMIGEAARLRDAGDIEGAEAVEQFIVPTAAVGFIPEIGGMAAYGAKKAASGARRLSRPTPPAAVSDLSARPTYVRGQEGPFTTIERSDLAAQPIPEATQTSSLAALRNLAQDRTRSPAIRAADTSSMEARGVPYDESAPLPVSSLVRQAGIGRSFGAAVEGSPEYKSALFERYGEMMPEVVEQAKAQNLDQLTEAAYRQLGDEVTSQFDTLPLRFKYHEGPGEYGSSTEMIQDALGRGQLNVFSGGEPHEFLNRVDPATGLSQNEMFRAVHDYMGHVVPGSRFGPSGEEIAYAAHAQQLSPLAQMALLSETRGQNSFVNYSPINADIIGESNLLRKQLRERKLAEGMVAAGRPDAARYLDQLPTEEEIAARLRELGQQTQYAPQNAVLLPPEYLDPMSPGGTPEWLRPLLSRPDASNDVRGVQISRVADLQTADPAFYGTGHRGQDYKRVSGDPTIPKRTHFYSGPEGTIVPEDQVVGTGQFDEGPRFAYEANLGNLYDIDADPAGLSKLAQAYNLPKFKPTLSLQDRLASRQVGLEPRSAISDLERLVRDYGYSGYLADFDPFGGGRRAAAVYEPVSGLRPIERGPKGYAEGGYASGNSA